MDWHALFVFLGLIVYDIQVRIISVLVNGIRDAGIHEIEWTASGFSSGIYVVEMRANDFSATQKMLLLK